MKKTLLLTALALAGGMVHASIVSGTVTAVSPDTGSAGGTFTQLTTFPAGYKVGNNNINVNDTVFGFDEQQTTLATPGVRQGNHPCCHDTGFQPLCVFRPRHKHKNAKPDDHRIGDI
ncbi:MAG: hypothetical protein IPH37_14055 [Burkholderiales bacterium]|nr:hypothetical protein [Burkholderiales bacterium]